MTAYANGGLLVGTQGPLDHLKKLINIERPPEMSDPRNLEYMGVVATSGYQKRLRAAASCHGCHIVPASIRKPCA